MEALKWIKGIKIYKLIDMLIINNYLLFYCIIVLL